MFHSWKRELQIRRVLRAVSTQRVAALLQPGDVWVIERAPALDQGTQADLRTCHLRGWVEVLHDAVPRSLLEPDGSLPSRIEIRAVNPMYRLTEAGWAALRRTHTWVVATFVVAMASLVVAVAAILTAT